MIRALVFAAALFALPASAGGMWRSDVRPGQVRCSDRAAPAVTPVEVTTGDDLETEIAAACSAGPGIVELAAGTYTDRNVQIGTGGATIGGLCVIRADNPASKPLIRATVGTARAVFQVRNVGHEIRFENLQIDGRRGAQTAASMSEVCDDDGFGVCDPGGLGGGQSTPAAMGIDSRKTFGDPETTCVLNVDVIETVGDAFFLRNQLDSAVEGATVDGAGCDTTTCPALSIPADSVLESILTNGRGVNWVQSSKVMAVDVSITDATKQGVQCIDSTECYLIANDISVIGSTGATMLASSGVVLGNLIDDVGSNWAQNSTTVSNGEGILATDADVDFEVAIRGNAISNTWGNGIRVELGSGTPPEPIVNVERNTMTTLCTGSTLTTNAAMLLGDGTDPFERITDIGNTISGSACATAKRVRNLTSYTASGTVIGSSTSGDGVTYEDVVISETSLTTDKDVEIDAASSGSLSGCTLNGGAVVNDASGGAVARSGGC